MTEPIDTAQVREDVAGERFAELIGRLCDEIDRLQEPERIVTVALGLASETRFTPAEVLDMMHAVGGWRERIDTLRAAHNGLLRRLRDEMNTWRPEHLGAKECATRVLRALGDEMGD